MSLDPVRLPGRYFTRGERRFIPVGAHWVPAKAALDWPYAWDPESVEADFAKMQDLGFNTVRFDLFWAWFEPHPGVYNPKAFQQLDHLIALAHKYQIYLHPTLFIGGEVGEAYWDVPWRHGRHPHADPEMLRLQTDHAAELARRYRGEKAILAWDLTDEPPYWIVSGSTTDAMAVNWTRLIAWALRRHDPEHALCVGTSMEDVSRGPFRPDVIAEEVDFFSAHPYSIYALGLFPDPMLSERGTYCGAFQTLLSGGAGRPVMIHELGASSAQYTPERIAAFDNVTMYSSLAAGANGFLLWCFTDAAPDTFRRSPYLRAPHETQFGLTTWDGQDRPQGETLRRFSRVLARMDLQGLAPEPATAAIPVPEEWAAPHGDFSRLGLTSSAPYVSTQQGGVVAGQDLPDTGEASGWLVASLLSALVLARRAGLKAAFPREYAKKVGPVDVTWEESPLVLAPAPLTATEHIVTHLHTTFWERAKAYVANGGTLYASVCADTAIPEMDELFGARLADHAPVESVTLRVVKEFGGLQPGEEFHFQPDASDHRHWPATIELRGGEVIAVDQDGRPALVANAYGSGKTLLCTYPIESYLARRPGAFEGDEQTHRLYQALRMWAGAQAEFSTDQPSVEAAGISGEGRGYAVLANHSGKALAVKVTANAPVRAARLVTPDGYQLLKVDSHGWEMSLPAHGGAVVEFSATGFTGDAG